jgi:hypothetical protein
MKVKEILGEAIVTQHLLYDPNNDAGPYNMTNQNGPFDMRTVPPSDEEEEDTCDTCHGTGLVTIYNYDGAGSDADDQPCPDCQGIGRYGNEEEEDGDEELELEICSNCNGSGEGMYPGSRCRACKGSGVIDRRDPDDDYHPGMEHDYGRE